MTSQQQERAAHRAAAAALDLPPAATTFYHDGYTDRMTGRPKQPPYHPATTVYALEYLEGWKAAEVIPCQN